MFYSARWLRASGSGWCHAELLGHPRKIRQVSDSKLVHDAGTMDLDGLLDGTQVKGDLLVEAATDHMTEHFFFARGQGGEERLEIHTRGTLTSAGMIMLQRPADGVEQHFSLDRLDEE